MTQPSPTPRDQALGLAFGVYCALMWSGYLVVARMGATGALQGPEQASLRAFGSGMILLPRFLYSWRRLVRQQGWPRLVALAVLVGPLYALVFVTGMQFAPAGHAGVIAPSAGAVLTALIAWPVLGEKPTRGRVMGLAIIVTGVLLIGWDGVSGAHPGAWRGIPFFLLGATCWATFTVLLRRWGLNGLDATAVVAVLSLPYVPIHLLWRGERFLAVPWTELLLQLAMQGPLTGVLASIAYARAVWLLGAAPASTIASLVPVGATTLGWAVLGEPLSIRQLGGMAICVAGVLCVVLLPSRRRSE